MFTSSPMTDRRQAGFSLVEILIAAAIGVFLLLLLVSILIQFSSRTQLIQKQSSYRIDTAVLERELFDDLAGVSPSMGNLNTKDTKNPVLDFFEYYGGIPVARLPATGVSREYTLDYQTASSFEFISENHRDGERNYYDPKQAYLAQLSFNAPGPLTYKGANSANFLSDHYADHWARGGHFFFYTPGALQATTGPAGFAGFRPVRYYSFLAFPNGNDLAADDLSGSFQTLHPVVNQNITSFDSFLRLIPALGGSMGQVLVVPVDIVRYRIEPDPNNRDAGGKIQAGRVFRSIRAQGTYKNEKFVGDGIKQLIFRRPDVTSRRMDYQIVVQSEVK